MIKSELQEITTKDISEYKLLEYNDGECILVVIVDDFQKETGTIIYSNNMNDEYRLLKHTKNFTWLIQNEKQYWKPFLNNSVIISQDNNE